MIQQLKSLLNGNQELRPLLDKAQALSVLQSHLLSVAPPHLAQSIQVLGLSCGTLVIAVANSAIAAKLRQHIPELITMLQSRRCEVNGIRIKVQVSYKRSTPPPTPRKLGKTAHHAINELIHTLKDSPLRRTLKKLSGTSE